MIVAQARNEAFHEIKATQRYARLLEQERTNAGITRSELARKLSEFNVSEADVTAWESGEKSPRCDAYYSAFCHLGKRAFERAAQLDSEIQFEMGEKLGLMPLRKDRDDKELQTNVSIRTLSDSPRKDLLFDSLRLQPTFQEWKA